MPLVQMGRNKLEVIWDSYRLCCYFKRAFKFTFFTWFQNVVPTGKPGILGFKTDFNLDTSLVQNGQRSSF